MRLPRFSASGWREFGREVGIVVLGVLIALVAEGAVDDWQWQRRVTLVDHGIRAELLNAAEVGYERLIVQPCLRSRISELAGKLANDEDELWKAAPLQANSRWYVNVIPSVYRAPIRPLPMDTWTSAIDAGTLDHMPATRVREFSGIYEQIRSYNHYQAEEAKLAARLSRLSFNARLDSRTRGELLSALAEVDEANTSLAVVAQQLIERVRGMNLGFDSRQVGRDRGEILAEQKANRGDCVASVPLDLGRQR